MLLKFMAFLPHSGAAMSDTGRVVLPENPKVLGYSEEAFEVLLQRQTEGRLRAALEAGEIPRRNEARARERLDELVAIREQGEKAIEDGRREREIAASERAAMAAERSARWAALAVFISLAALLVATLPLTPLFR
jgi:hypothetical protein